MLLNYNKFLNENKYTKKTLNPIFWNDNLEFDENVRKKLLKIANDFYGSLDLDLEIKDILLTGSMANFNYTNHSDLDVHIVIDFDEYDGDNDVLEQLMKTKAFVWNLKHDIVIRKADVELYIHNKNESHISTGLFSLLNNKWNKKPEYNDPDVDEDDVKSKYDKWVYEIEQLEKVVSDKNIDNEEYEKYYNKSEKMKNKLRKFRKKGLEDKGEFSVENVTFKKLRNDGYINKLYEISTDFYDSMFSQ